MKCHACSYERIIETRTVTVPHFFKSGTRKGEFKCVVEEEIKFVLGDEDFYTINVMVQSDGGIYQSHTTAEIIVCPKCSTMKYSG